MIESMICEANIFTGINKLKYSAKAETKMFKMWNEQMSQKNETIWQ